MWHVRQHKTNIVLVTLTEKEGLFQHIGRTGVISSHNHFVKESPHNWFDVLLLLRHKTRALKIQDHCYFILFSHDNDIVSQL